MCSLALVFLANKELHNIKKPWAAYCYSRTPYDSFFFGKKMNNNSGPDRYLHLPVAQHHMFLALRNSATNKTVFGSDPMGPAPHLLFITLQFRIAPPFPFF